MKTERKNEKRKVKNKTEHGMVTPHINCIKTSVVVKKNKNSIMDFVRNVYAPGSISSLFAGWFLDWFRLTGAGLL